MGYTGINLGNVKVNNRSAILKLLNNEGAATRKDIAWTLGLTPATVTLITSELLEAGIINEEGEVTGEKRAGRRKVLIDLNENYRYVLTVSLEENDTVISLCNLKGKMILREDLCTEHAGTPEVFLNTISQHAITMMWNAGISRGELLGIGVSVPGPVDRENGISLHAYRIWDEAVPIREILRKKVDIPIVVENNVRAFAIGEQVYGIGKNHENLLIVKWGPGVGSSILIDGEIYDTGNSQSADIGHMIAEKGGRECHCGRRGCLETYISTHAIVATVQEACEQGKLPQLQNYVRENQLQIQASNISSWITCPDPGIQEVLNPVFERFASKLVNMAILLAPDKVVFYGKMFDLPQFKEGLQRALISFDPHFSEEYFILSGLESKRPFIGPLAVAVNELFLQNGGALEG